MGHLHLHTAPKTCFTDLINLSPVPSKLFGGLTLQANKFSTTNRVDFIISASLSTSSILSHRSSQTTSASVLYHPPQLNNLTGCKSSRNCLGKGPRETSATVTVVVTVPLRRPPHPNPVVLVEDLVAMIMRTPPTPTKNCRQGGLPLKANSRFTETILR